jgi:hypothetical protein
MAGATGPDPLAAQHPNAGETKDLATFMGCLLFHVCGGSILCG